MSWQFYFNTHMNICISMSKLLTLKLEVLSCSKPDCFDLLFFNVFICLLCPGSDTPMYSEQYSQIGQNIVLLIACVFKKNYFLLILTTMKSLKTSVKQKNYITSGLWKSVYVLIIPRHFILVLGLLFLYAN